MAYLAFGVATHLGPRRPTTSEREMQGRRMQLPDGWWWPWCPVNIWIIFGGLIPVTFAAVTQLSCWCSTHPTGPSHKSGETKGQSGRGSVSPPGHSHCLNHKTLNCEILDLTLYQSTHATDMLLYRTLYQSTHITISSKMSSHSELALEITSLGVKIFCGSTPSSQLWEATGNVTADMFSHSSEAILWYFWNTTQNLYSRVGLRICRARCRNGLQDNPFVSSPLGLAAARQRSGKAVVQGLFKVRGPMEQHWLHWLRAGSGATKAKVSHTAWINTTPDCKRGLAWVTARGCLGKGCCTLPSSLKKKKEYNFEGTTHRATKNRSVIQQ